ncbi:MAG: sugar phosphate nucleotidyltransferase [Methanomassiliicoccales archaeon]|nr:sugar phosphate nucleotidyltransferase [Methanomassiliicoccales archaeon]
MKAVILAAGEGMRLRPFTYSRPKPMLQIGNKPILEYVVDALVSNDIKDIIMVVGYKKEKIMSYFQDGARFNAKISYAFQEKQIGTAHALLSARHLLDESFIVLAGDNLIDAETVSDLLRNGRIPSILVTESDIPSKYGVVQLEGNKIVSIVEKPESTVGNIISTGVYLFNDEILEVIETEVSSGALGITNAMQKMLGRLDIYAVKTRGKWIDVVYPWDIIRVNAVALSFEGQAISGIIEDNVMIRGPVVIGAGTRVRSGTYINGPVLIGEGCDIGPNVSIFPTTSIGNNVHIDAYTYVSNSVIMNNVCIGSHSHLSHTAIDEGVRIASSLSCVCGHAFAKIDDEFFKLENIGALIGEDTTIGSHVTIVPGTIVGAGCRISDGVRVSGNLENRCVVV